MTDERPAIDVALGVPIPGKLQPGKFCQGVPLGSTMPDIPLSSITGNISTLSEIWSGQLALLVTGSISCPPSRRTVPEAFSLEQRFPCLRSAVIYVIDAHPSGEANPYTGVEWVTEENRAAGILVSQPVDQAERSRLAREYQRLLSLESEVLVDGMDNQAWQAMGSGPNTAVVVDDQGRVLACQEWFEPDTLAQWLESHLA